MLPSVKDCQHTELGRDRLMADYYGASFTIDGSVNNPEFQGLKLMSEVSIIVREWAQERFDIQLEDDATGEWTDKNDAFLRIAHDEVGEMGLFDLRLDHPDKELENVTWRTEFRLATKGQSVDVDAEVKEINDRQNSTAHSGGIASRPRVLEVIFDNFECRFGAERLSKQVMELTIADAQAFALEDVFGTDRRMPIIVVTKNRYGGIFVNPHRLQSRLLGLARVATYDDDTAQSVNQNLGNLKCFGGAVRIYRPGCSMDDIPWKNRFWKGKTIWEIGWEQFLSEVKAACEECTSLHADTPTYYEVQKAIVQAAKADARAGEELQDYYARIESDNQFLTNEVRRLTETNKQLLIAQQYTDPAEPVESMEDDVPQEFKSVIEVVNQASRSLAGLRFLDSAFASARKSQFRRPKDVYNVFMVLDACASERENGALGKGVEPWLSDRGITYTPTESITTTGQLSGKRDFLDKDTGELVTMDPHISVGGGGNNPQLQIRIHLIWEASENKWLIGHVGEHLPTSSDPH